MQQALSQAFGTFARHSLTHSHALFGTAFGSTNATNKTRQHGIAWNQTSLGLTNKHFQPKPDLSINKTPRWTSANQPQSSQSTRKALQKKNAKPAPLERFPHETQWCDSLWFHLLWADLTTTKTRFRSPLLKCIPYCLPLQQEFLTVSPLLIGSMKVMQTCKTKFRFDHQGGFIHHFYIVRPLEGNIELPRPVA